MMTKTATHNIVQNDNPAKVRDLIEEHTLFPHHLWCSFTYFPNVKIPSVPNFHMNRSLNHTAYELHPIHTAQHLQYFLRYTASKLRTHLHVPLIVGEHLHKGAMTTDGTRTRHADTYHYHAIISVQREKYVDKVMKRLRNDFRGNTHIELYADNTSFGPMTYFDVEDTYHANSVYYSLGRHNQWVPSTLDLHGVYCGHSKRCTRASLCSFSMTEMFQSTPSLLQNTLSYKLSQREAYYKSLIM